MGKLTESDLYAIGMESDTAYKHMQEICERLGLSFPPELERETAKETENV